MFKNFFLIDCSKAENCCDRAQYEELSSINKLKLRLHVFLCRKCKEYTSRNSKLTRLLKSSNLKTCSEKEKTVWKEQIKEELAKQNS